ncbi:chaplin [Streptomyces sp. NPDC000878]
MTAEKGNLMKKSVAVIAGAIMALGMASPAFADAEAEGFAAHSPGVLSGNVVQVPVHVPVNVCGNSINVIALLNPAFGNTCVND